jgi:hypothetical protein
VLLVNWLDSENLSFSVEESELDEKKQLDVRCSEVESGIGLRKPMGERNEETSENIGRNLCILSIDRLRWCI